MCVQTLNSASCECNDSSKVMVDEECVSMSLIHNNYYFAKLACYKVHCLLRMQWNLTIVDTARPIKKQNFLLERGVLILEVDLYTKVYYWDLSD